MGQKGFTLIEAVLGLFVSLIILAGFYVFYDMTILNIRTVEHKIAQSGGKYLLRKSLEPTCSQFNTVSYQLNDLTCLQNDTCTHGKTGPLTVFDDKGDVFNSPGQTRWSKDFNSCPADLENKDQYCPYVLYSSFKVLCGAAGCTRPDLLVRFEMRKVSSDETPGELVEAFDNILTPQKRYHSCAEVAASGKTIHGFYTVDPDGFAGLCPFQIYCSLESTGAKSLIASAPVAGYDMLLEVDPPLGPETLGRLNDKYLSAILNRSDSQKKVTAMIKGSAQGDLTVPLQLLTTSKGLHTGATQYCEDGNTSFVSSFLNSTGFWGAITKNFDASIGYSERVESGKMDGFHCLNCQSSSTCGLGSNSCCQKNLAGSLWYQ